MKGFSECLGLQQDFPQTLTGYRIWEGKGLGLGIECSRPRESIAQGIGNSTLSFLFSGRGVLL